MRRALSVCLAQSPSPSPICPDDEATEAGSSVSVHTTLPTYCTYLSSTVLTTAALPSTLLARPILYLMSLLCVHGKPHSHTPFNMALPHQPGRLHIVACYGTHSHAAARQISPARLTPAVPPILHPQSALPSAQ